jgi:hypothetical protein
MPARGLLVVLALVAATAAAAYAVLRGLSAQPGHRFEEAYELKKALLAGRLSGVMVSVEARPMAINLTIDNVKYTVGASRVLVAFPAKGPVFEEPTPEPWRVWGNGTHFGVVSYVKVEDTGYTIRVYYFNASSYRGASVCVYASGGKPLQFYARTGGKVEWYSFKGPREVVVQEVRVEPCRQ